MTPPERAGTPTTGPWDPAGCVEPICHAGEMRARVTHCAFHALAPTLAEAVRRLDGALERVLAEVGSGALSPDAREIVRLARSSLAVVAGEHVWGPWYALSNLPIQDGRLCREGHECERCECHEIREVVRDG